MAENKPNDTEMNGEDFSQDVSTNENENGGTTGTGSNGSNAAAANSNSTGGAAASATAAPAATYGNNENGNGNEASANNIRDDDRKLFVGGLSWETSERELREHFETFGEIESINVKTDPQTGRSRGFAFIVFTNTDAIDKVNETPEHVINNKKVDPKKAKARHGKIFVGGLTNEISDDEIKTYFSQFGHIVDVEMPFDKQKSQRKGFCFITFDSEPVVNELLKTPKQKISGREVDVKRATPKPDNLMAAMRGGARGGGTMRGGRGSYTRGGYAHQWAGQGSYPAYGGYSGGYDTGYGDYYGGGGFYNGYDYGYVLQSAYDTNSEYLPPSKRAKYAPKENETHEHYGYGGGYDGGYGGGSYGNGNGSGRSSGGPRGGPKGSSGYPTGKQRGTGGGRQPRHQPY